MPSNLARHIVDELQDLRQRPPRLDRLSRSRAADDAHRAAAEGAVRRRRGRDGSAAGIGGARRHRAVRHHPVGERPPIGDTATLLKIISDAPIGSTVAIEILREGQRQTLRVPIERQGQRIAPPARLTSRAANSAGSRAPGEPRRDHAGAALAATLAVVAALAVSGIARRLLTRVGRERHSPSRLRWARCASLRFMTFVVVFARAAFPALELAGVEPARRSAPARDRGAGPPKTGDPHRGDPAARVHGGPHPDDGHHAHRARSGGRHRTRRARAAQARANGRERRAAARSPR